MKNKKIYVMAAVISCMLAGFSFPAYAYASDGEDYITISVDAVDDNTNLQYAIDSDDESAFTSSNEFTVPAGTSHTIYVKDVAGNITSQRYEPQEEADYSVTYDDEEEQRINIDLELGRKEEEKIYSPDEEGSPGTASVTNRTKTDGSVDAEKVFYTFTTKEGEELYLVIDQGRGSDNVYLLDTVSLGDLRVLADGQTSSAVDDEKEDNLLASLQGEDSDTILEEPEAAPKKKSNSGQTIVILLLALLGGGGYYYLKIYRTKKDEAMDAMDAMDMDEFAPEDEEEEELDFAYDDEEKERYLDNLLNEGTEEEYFDQDPDAYATSHMDEDAEEETDIPEEDDDDEDSFKDIEGDF